jgi:hypothetical protein
MQKSFRVLSRFHSIPTIQAASFDYELQEADAQRRNLLVVFFDDGFHRRIPLRLWLFAHRLFDFLGATATLCAYRVFLLCWRHG